MASKVVVDTVQVRRLRRALDSALSICDEFSSYHIAPQDWDKARKSYRKYRNLVYRVSRYVRGTK